MSTSHSSYFVVNVIIIQTRERNLQSKLQPVSFVTRLTCWDVTDGEQADPRVAVHRPLLRLTVGLTAVVHEARVVSLRTGINDPVLKNTKKF